MLGNKTIDNLKAVSIGKPSLLVEKSIGMISVSIYIDNPSEKSEALVLAHLDALVMPESIQERPVYKVTGTSGAYPGFGSLAYQSMLIELSRAIDEPLFISDRESVTGFAEGIYHKMIASNEYKSLNIPTNNANFSLALEEDIMYDRIESAGLDADEIMDDDSFDDETYLEMIDSGKIPYLPLNLAYEWAGNDVTAKYHDLLLKNHTQRNLSIADVTEITNQGQSLGEYVTENYSDLISLRDNGFDSLTSAKTTTMDLCI